MSISRLISFKDREIKARKIEAVLQDYLGKKIEGYTILDFGAGSGLIGSHFALNNQVFYSDTADHRQEGPANTFIPIDDDVMQCEDERFDIIISNMVIEHTKAQTKHLTEIHRLLRRGGIVYLAAPNRIFPIELHYKLPLIHYAPYRLQPGILALFERFIKLPYPIEHVYLPSYFRLKRIIGELFDYHEYTAAVLKDPKKYQSEFFQFRYWPIFLLRKLCFISPTNIFILTK